MPENPAEARADETFWQQRARRIARAVNFAWWMDAVAFPVVAAAVVIAAVLLVLRNSPSPPPIAAMAAVAGVAAAGIAGVGYLRARRKFETPDQSLVRIEAALGIDNSLSAARAGITRWPAPRHCDAAAIGLRWQTRHLAIPPLAAILLVAAAWWIPVHNNHAAAGSHAAPQQPPAWERLDAELDALANAAAVDETYLEKTRERLEQLREQDSQHWFSHASMEATDGLMRSHRSEARRLDEEIQRASQALDHFSPAAADNSPESLDAQRQAFEQAIEGMRNGDMKPNAELLEKLSAINPDALKNLDPGQIDALREQLQRAGKALRQACENGACDGAPDDGDGDRPGENPGGQPGEDGEHAPGLLADEPANLPNAGDTTPLAAHDLSNAAIGDLLQLRSGEHDSPENRAAPLAGGNSSATGHGGSRVWRDSLDPAEQRAIRRFFE